MARITEVYLVELVKFEKSSRCHSNSPTTFNTVMFSDGIEAAEYCRKFNRDVDTTAVTYNKAFYSKAKVYPNY